jgi:hypothetical protein
MGVDGGRSQIARQSGLRDVRYIVQAGGFFEKKSSDVQPRPGLEAFAGQSPAELRRWTETTNRAKPTGFTRVLFHWVKAVWWIPQIKEG